MTPRLVEVRRNVLKRNDDLAALEAKWVERLGLIGRDVTAQMADGSTHRGRLNDLTFAGVELDVRASVVRFIPEAVRQLTSVRSAS